MTPSAPLKVLIVDDVEDIRAALRQMLEELEEVEIDEVGDGQDALDAMAETRYALLLLDLNLPVVSGEAVLAALAGDNGLKRPGHIVVMSAQANLAQLQARLGASGVDSFLAKPFRYGALQQIVADAFMPDFLDGL